MVGSSGAPVGHLDAQRLQVFDFAGVVGHQAHRCYLQVF
jgi:hypothetical protein